MENQSTKKRNLIMNLASIVLVVLFIIYAQGLKPLGISGHLDSYILRIINLCAIYTVLGLGLNLINGFTGQFSLGHAGFMAVGAYTTALLSMPIATKAQNFFMEPLIFPLNSIQLPFFLSLIIGGLTAALVAFIIGAPCLRLKGDYLAIATLGFAEIIRVVFTNLQNVTNGALGIKNIPGSVNLWWSFGFAIATIAVMFLLIRSSYGKALKAIREDEIAAEAMGINLFNHKVMAFMIGAFMAGLGGGLLASLLGTIDPLMFRFTLTFNILLIIVLGGMSSITGTVLGAFIVTISQEALRFLDAPITLGSISFQVSGLRMVVFSALLIIVVIFMRNGIMGSKEFTWDKLFGLFDRKNQKGEA